MQSAEEIELYRIHRIWMNEYPTRENEIVLFCDRILTMLNVLWGHSNNAVRESIQNFANHINITRNAYETYDNQRGRAGRGGRRSHRRSHRRSQRTRSRR
jgi:hypothetical protein